MTEALVVTIMLEAMRVTTLLAAPMLVAALVVGLVISIFQAVTQIHEMTLTFIPKILAVAAVMIFLLPWTLRRLIDFTVGLYSSIPTAIG